MSDDSLKVLYSGNINVDYGQFYIDYDYEDEGLIPPEVFEGHENGLCGSAFPGRLFFVVGPQFGVIEINVQLFTSEPAFDNSFEEIVEVSTKITKKVMLCEWGFEETHELNIPLDAYRVRYCIAGMEKDYDENDEDCDAPINGQKYLVQFWPNSPRKDVVVKTTSENATYWHNEWGSNNA